MMFTLDKLVRNLVRHANEIVNSEVCSCMLELHQYEMAASAIVRKRYLDNSTYILNGDPNENLFLATQTLNHNIKTEPFSLKHQINIGFKKHNNTMKPLMSKTVFVMLPYNSENPFEGLTENNPNMCLPVETKNHSYTNNNGESLSGHWVVFPGKEMYKYDITHQLQLKDNTTMHHIATHLHPFAETLAFRDKTLDSTLFVSKAENYIDKIGLKKVTYFSSKEGIMLYPDHD